MSHEEFYPSAYRDGGLSRSPSGARPQQHASSYAASTVGMAAPIGLGASRQTQRQQNMPHLAQLGEGIPAIQPSSAFSSFGPDDRFGVDRFNSFDQPRFDRATPPAFGAAAGLFGNANQASFAYNGGAATLNGPIGDASRPRGGPRRAPLHAVCARFPVPANNILTSWYVGVDDLE
jgi:hypothetical protein